MNAMDENTRRYYLDAMGIQCWQLRDAENHGDDSALVHEAGGQVVAAENTWPQLETDIQQCTNCSLHATRTQAIVGGGKRSAKLMFVLLAPGSADDEAGSICSGEAGELLSKMLSAINTSVDDVYITSLLKCCVPAAHTVTPKEIAACSYHLNQQVRLIKPRRVVVLGETAMRCLVQKDLSLDDYRAVNEQSPFQLASVPVFASYSPAELLSQAGNKRKAWLDLQQLQKIIES